MSKQGEKQVRLSLGLQDDDASDQPRRFLRLPSGHLLAYGGDNGNVSCLLPEESTNSDGIDEKSKIESEGIKFVVVQSYDDAVRCIAVSQDGKRLAVGFDTGKTQIHCFDEFVYQENHTRTRTCTGSELSPHPYVQTLENNQTTEEKDSDDFLLSQDSNTEGDDNLSYFAGPDLGAPARDMLFLPHKRGNESGDDDTGTSSLHDSYLLAIASEAGMFVVDATNKEIMAGSEHLLEQEAKESHDQCGIRGLAASIVETCGNKSNGSDNAREKMTVLASLAMDGRLCLWDVTGKRLLQREDQLCVPKKDIGEIHHADAYDRSCHPVIFHPSLNSEQDTDFIIGTPGRLMPCIRVLQLNGEDEKLKVLDDSSFEADAENGHMQSIVTILFCSDHLLVTSGRDGRVLVWVGRHPSHDVETKNKNISSDTDEFLSMKWKVVEKFQLESPVTDLCVQQYQSKEKVSLFSACANGSLEVLDISKHHHHLKNICKKSSIDNKITKVNYNCDLDNDEETSTSATNVTASNTTKSKDRSQNSPRKSVAPKVLKKGRFSDNGDEDDSVGFSSPAPKNVHFLEEAEEDDINDQDEGKADVTNTTISRNGFDTLGDDSDEEDDSLADEDLTRLPLIPNQTRVMDIVKPQPAFSPSSTPLDLTRRFLCWNHIGSVTLLQGDNNRNTIDINYADSAFKRPISFTDNINFIIGSVGESGGIFASDTKDDDEDMDGEDIDGLDEFNMSERTKQAVRRDRKKRAKNSDNSKPTGSSIFFYRFETSELVNRKNKDWHLILPDGERVLGAACGEGWAAAMTSRQFLRLFSPGGNQNQMVWLKGEPVTMVGRGRFLAVFYHESSPLANKTQQLGYTLWDAADFRVISRGSVACLSKGSSLSWVGFSNDLSLMVMDTDGMLSMLVTTGQDSSYETLVWEWAPILDTVGLRKSTDDCHWPVTVHNGKLVCIPLKGGNTYPDATRRPVTTTLGLRMPLAKSAISKNSALEELSIRSNIAITQKKLIRELGCDAEERDAEELEEEYAKLCAQVDKVTLKLFSAMVDAGKLEGAFELVSRLHLEKSYDLAIRIANRQYKLADEIEKAKNFKFLEDEDDDNYDYEDEDHTPGDFRVSKSSMEHNDDIQSKHISPDSSRTHKRSIKLHQPVGTENKRHRVS